MVILFRKTILILVIVCMATASVYCDLLVFDMETSDPVTNTWIAGNGEGSQTHQLSSSIYYDGSYSLRWDYTLPSTPSGNYPTIEMSIPSADSNWTGATKLGVWMYFDLTGTKTYWTIQPVLCHPYPTVTELGNWNAGATGVPNETWIYHEWDISGVSDISDVSHLRFYYHAGDGWESLAKSGTVTIYLDDISVDRPEGSDKTLCITEPVSECLRFEGAYNAEFVGSVYYVAHYGRWGDIRGWLNSSGTNIVSGGGAFYDHPICWHSSGWSDGTYVTHSLVDDFGRMIEWNGEWAYNDGTHNFSTQLVSQKIAILDDDILAVRTEGRLYHNQAASDIRMTYVEFGWGMDRYTTTAIVRRDGESSTNIVSTTPMDMTTAPATHYFDGQILYRSQGDYLCGYGGTTFNVSVALVPLGWDSSGQAYARAWDTNGIIDTTDTIELHYYNPVFAGTNKSVSAGESHTITYYALVSPVGVTGYDWVPSITDLEDAFDQFSFVNDWSLY